VLRPSRPPRPPAARSAPSRSTPRKLPATNRARAPLRPITSNASGPVNRVLTGTTAAPAPSVPRAVSKPLGPVRRPYRHPVPGPDARVDQRAGDRGRPLVQFAVAEPEPLSPAGFRHRLRVAEIPRRPGHGGRDRQLHRTSHRPLPNKQLLGRLSLSTGGGPGAVHAAGRGVPRRGARVAGSQPDRRVRRPARRGRAGPRARAARRAAGLEPAPGRRGLDLPGLARRTRRPRRHPDPARSSSTRSTRRPARRPGSRSWARNCSART